MIAANSFGKDLDNVVTDLKVRKVQVDFIILAREFYVTK